MVRIVEKGAQMMITVKLSEKIQKKQLFEKIRELNQLGIDSFEFNVRTFEGRKLILAADLGRVDASESPSNRIFLKELFEYIKDLPKDLKIVLNLQVPNLENLVKVYVEEWDLNSQIKYTGQVEPTNLTPWDKADIYYNVENCLPNFYQLEAIKKTHFDVIYYFCRKYKVNNIRIHEKTMTPDIVRWANAYDLNLSIYGVETIELAEEFYSKGIAQVTTTDVESVSMNKLFKEM